MPDIFDQVAAPARPSGDIFDKVAPPRLSEQLPHPDDVQQITTQRAQQYADVMTRPQPEMVAQAPVTPSPMEHLKDLPRAAYAAYSASRQIVKEHRGEPMVSFDKMLPKTTGPGVLRTASEIASSLTSPDNLAMIGGTAGLGEIAPALSKLIGMGFSSEQTWQAIVGSGEFQTAVKKGDWPAARAALTKVGITAGLAAAGLKASVKADESPASKPAAKPAPKPAKSQPAAKQEYTITGKPVRQPSQEPTQSRTSPEARRTEILDKGKEAAGGNDRNLGTQQVEAPPGNREPGRPQQVISEGNGRTVLPGLPGEKGGRPPVSEPSPAAGSESSSNGGVRRVTGSADIPLTDEGRQHARELAAKVPPDVQVFHADNERSTETGRTVSPRAQSANWLEPWKLGQHEGKPLESERDAINARITDNPDESPGISPSTGEKGESFNEVRHRLIGGVQDQAARMPADGKVLNITSGRALQIIDAWAKKGQPPNRQVDTGAMVKDEEFSKPGDLFELGPKGLMPVDKILPGKALNGPEQYFAQHGATEWNGGGGGKTLSAPQKPAENTELASSPPARVTGGVTEPQPPAPAAPTAQNPSAVRQFMGEETGTSRVGAILKADIGEMRALKSKRDAALAELERTKETPEEKGFGKKIISYFTGERDIWGARVNQIMRTLRGRVPDPQEQEALTLMRDFKNKPEELTQFLAGTHPALGEHPAEAMQQIEKLRPVILKALNPTERMKEADEVLSKIAAGTLQEGQRLGFLESRWTPDEYNPHILHPKGQGAFAEPPGRMGRLMGGNLGKYFAFAERREYPTVLHAIADRVRPKTLNALDAFTIHGDKFATARATHLLEDQLRETGVGKYTSDGKQPVGWVALAAHSPEFKKAIPFLRQEGTAQNSQAVAQYKLEQLRAGKPYSEIPSPVEPGALVPDIAHQQMYVPAYVEKALSPITDPDFTARLPGFKAARMVQSYQKAVQLGLSLFHATTENYMALANMGPTGWYKGLRVSRDAPDFLRAERDFIAHGGTSSIQGNTVEAYKSLQPGSIPSWLDIARKFTPIRIMDQAANKVTDFTFGNLQRRFKVMDYALHNAAWLADHPNATDSELRAAKQSISKEINAVYGGLHWEHLGVNHASVEIARAVLLAPDWTFSNVFNVKYSLEGRTPAGKAARLFWARQLVGGMAATELLSLALSGKPSKNPTQVYFGDDPDGQEIYQNVFFKGASGDVINFVHNTIDYGFPEGPARTLTAKVAGGLRIAGMLYTNEDYLHHPLAAKGMNPLASSLRTTYKIGEASAPIPFSAMNLYQMLLGPDKDKFSKAELGTTLFSGNPPRHVAPEGMEMTPEGLKEKPYKETRPFWEQVTTGKP